MRPTTIPPTVPVPNGDETAPYIGSFHKTLPHDSHGVVDAAAYREFMKAAADKRPGPVAPTFEAMSSGQVPPGGVPSGQKAAAKLVSPQAGRAREGLGIDPFDIELWPPPRVTSDSTAAEMTEVFWMALWRDVSLDALHNPDPVTMNAVQDAVAELSSAFNRALATDKAGQGDDAGRHLKPGLGLGLDLPCGADGKLGLNAQTLFRSGFPDEQHGPLVSQFFLHDVPFGTQTIHQSQLPYARNRNYLQNVADWLMAQNIGRDRFGRDYSQANHHADDATAYEQTPRYIGTMRDLARFVHKDALHQAYFNAALLLLAWEAEVDEGNPYRSRLKRQASFATLGGPNLLTMVSEVASRALKVVWRQKWLVHRRLRPEAYGGLMTMQAFHGRDFGLPDWVFRTRAAGAIRNLNRSANENTPHAQEDNFLLPMAFSSGSPVHPAYGAGHATVAGACVTVLKAWFDEKQPLKPLIETKLHPETRAPLRLLKAHHTTGRPDPYLGDDAAAMTIGGELNKIASNVAMGRTMGGVHWRSDNTRSLRLGEIIATAIMAREVKEFAEAGVKLSYCSFDGHAVTITPDGVTVPTDAPLQAYYAELLQRAGV
jgi:hypothetical protein